MPTGRPIRPTTRLNKRKLGIAGFSGRRFLSCRGPRQRRPRHGTLGNQHRHSLLVPWGIRDWYPKGGGATCLQGELRRLWGAEGVAAGEARGVRCCTLHHGAADEGVRASRRIRCKPVRTMVSDRAAPRWNRPFMTRDLCNTVDLSITSSRRSIPLNQVYRTAGRGRC